MRFANRRAAQEQSGGVMKRSAASFVSIDKSDQQRGLSDAAMEFVQNLERFRNEARFEDKILGRITGDRQLGRDHEFGAGHGQTLVGLKDPFEITAQIADGRIELSEADFHLRGNIHAVSAIFSLKMWHRLAAAVSDRRSKRRHGDETSPLRFRYLPVSSTARCL